MRVFTGIQPSGKLHIGNYFGAMLPMLKRQQTDELFAFIANLHSLTSVHDAALLRQQTLDVAIDWLALGLDPTKTTFWVQSDVPEVAELSWYLSTICPMGLLERAHSYKDKTAKGIAASHALFSYPVLMAADILGFQSDIVPVGKDQKQHVEIARDLAEKFNFTFGETFTIPEPEIAADVATIPGIDGEKMSKSYGNTIDIFAEGKELEKQVMRIVTDSKGVDEPKDPETCHVFAIYKFFGTAEEIAALAERYRKGGIGYGEAKKMLLAKIDAYFSEARERRKKILRNPQSIEQILKSGAEKARTVAQKTMERVRKAVGVR